MIWRVKKNNLQHRLVKLTNWHRRWAFFPKLINDDKDETVWVWMQWYYRKCRASIECEQKLWGNGYYERIVITDEKYASDDFDLIRRTK